MATVFQWSGKTTKGTVESGEITAASKDEVMAQLRKKNITPTIITEKRLPKSYSAGAARLRIRILLYSQDSFP